jgi:hypothetical protein
MSHEKSSYPKITFIGSWSARLTSHFFGAQTEELREETDEPMPQTEGVGSRPVEQEATPLPTHLPISLSQELDWRVNCEGLMRAAGQNLKRLLKKREWGRRPFPAEAMYASFWVLLRDMLVLALEEWSLLVSIGSASSMVRTPCVSLCG